jgi:hypothetical protein
MVHGSAVPSRLTRHQPGARSIRRRATGCWPLIFNQWVLGLNPLNLLDFLCLIASI